MQKKPSQVKKAYMEHSMYYLFRERFCYGCCAAGLENDSPELITSEGRGSILT